MRIGIIGKGVMAKSIAKEILKLKEHHVTMIIKDSYADNNGLSIERGKLWDNFMKNKEFAEANCSISQFAVKCFKVLEKESNEENKVFDIIIESVTEDIFIKQQVFDEIDTKLSFKYTNPDTIICTNTSGIKLKELQKPEYDFTIYGAHFFNPVSHTGLVEINVPHETSVTRLNKLLLLILSLDKQIIYLSDLCPSIVNHLLLNMINEACNMLNLTPGYDVITIDKAMKFGANMKMGPFELADLIGIDIVGNTLEEYGITPSVNLTNLVRENKLGKKTGEGFYNYNL